MPRSTAAPLLAGIALFWLSACSGPPTPEATGAEIYQELCATCHGEDLSGGLGPALGAGSNSADQDDSFLELTISRGRGRMPSFSGTLSDEQLDRLIDFMREQQ